MTTEQSKETAREIAGRASFDCEHAPDCMWACEECIQTTVASALLDATARERAACAKVAEEWRTANYGCDQAWGVADGIAGAIRSQSSGEGDGAARVQATAPGAFTLKPAVAVTSAPLSARPAGVVVVSKDAAANAEAIAVIEREGLCLGSNPFEPDSSRYAVWKHHPLAGMPTTEAFGPTLSLALDAYRKATGQFGGRKR